MSIYIDGYLELPRQPIFIQPFFHHVILVIQIVKLPLKKGMYDEFVWNAIMIKQFIIVVVGC